MLLAPVARALGYRGRYERYSGARHSRDGEPV
jgi:hypothetical protein